MNVALLGLALGGCRALRGPFGFAVTEPVIIPCEGDDGPLAIGWVSSGRRSDHCFDFLDEPAPEPSKDYTRCEAAGPDIRDPETGLCTTSILLIAPYRQQLSWVWELDEPDVLVGAVADRADHTTCTRADNDDADEDGPNVHALLEGTIAISEDRGDEAVVEFDLDGLWGTVTFEVCR